MAVHFAGKKVACSIMTKPSYVDNLEATNEALQIEVSNLNNSLLATTEELQNITTQLNNKIAENNTLQEQLANQSTPSVSVSAPINFVNPVRKKITDRYEAVYSGSSSGALGFYLIDKEDKTLTQIVTEGYNYGAVLKITDNKLIVYNSSKRLLYKINLDTKSLVGSISGSSAATSPAIYSGSIGTKWLIQSTNSSGYWFYVNHDTFDIRTYPYGSATLWLTIDDYLIKIVGTTITITNGLTNKTTTLTSSTAMVGAIYAADNIMLLSDGAGNITPLNLGTTPTLGTSYSSELGTITGRKNAMYIGNNKFVSSTTLYDMTTNTTKTLSVSHGTIGDYCVIDTTFHLYINNGVLCTYDELTNICTSLDTAANSIIPINETTFKIASGSFNYIYDYSTKSTKDFKFIL